MLKQKKNNININLFLCCLIAFVSSSYSQIYNTKVEANINLLNNNEFVEITGTAYNKTEVSQSIKYVLSVIKNNPKNSNRSKNDQKGRVLLNAGEKINLSKTTINSNNKDRIIILLLLYDIRENIIGKARIVINDTINSKIKKDNKENNSPDVKFKNSDGIVLRGIVIEETKTNPGRNFYKMFYSLYTSNNINGEKIVTVEEILILAGTTAIRVLVGDEVVYQFIVKPQKGYLKENSNEALKRVFSYLQNIKKENNLVKRY